MRGKVRDFTLHLGQKSLLWLKIAVLVIAGLIPALTFEKAEAAQLTSRKVTIGTSALGAEDVTYTFQFKIPTAGEIHGIMYRFCTSPIGACSLPSGMDLHQTGVDAATSDSLTGWTDTTAFTLHGATDENDCDMSTSSNLLCFERTPSDPEAANATLTHVISGIDSPAVPDTVYIRISTYNNSDFQSANEVDQGIVAAAYVNQLTVTGIVAERLEFCVGAFDAGAATPDHCQDNWPSSTEIALGLIDTSIVTSPVATTTSNPGNNKFGAFNVNTNASSGVTVTYFPEETTSVLNSDTDKLRSFRVSPADCSPTPGSSTDQCFESAENTGTDFGSLSGLEGFGFSVACIDDTGSSTTAFSGNVSSGYVGTGGTAASANCESEVNDFFGFNESANPATIVFSTGVVDDEFVKLQHGAVASATTPTGAYQVILTYIATPTF